MVVESECYLSCSYNLCKSTLELQLVRHLLTVYKEHTKINQIKYKKTMQVLTPEGEEFLNELKA